MKLPYWDAEFKSVRDDLVAIRMFQHDTAQRERVALVGLRLSIVQLQVRLAGILDRITSYHPQQSMMRGATRALVHWSCHFAQLCRDLYTSQIADLGKSMWLSLIQARIPGLSSRTAFNDEQMIEIAIRFQQMRKVKEQLERELADLRAEKQTLKYRYDDLMTALNNREAAGSFFAYFGRNLQESRENPTLQKLGKVLRGVVRSVSLPKNRYHYLHDLQQAIGAQSDQLIQNCKSLVLQDLGLDVPKQKLGERELHASLREIDKLREQLQVATDLLDHVLEPVHPKIQRSKKPIA